MQPRPIAETSREPNFRCFTYVPDSPALPQSYARRLPLFRACCRSARGAAGLGAVRRGAALSVPLGTWMASCPATCNLRADDGGLAQPARVGELFDDEVGHVRARDLL